jgi:hypothetical protein
MKEAANSLMKQIIEWGIRSSGTLHSFNVWWVANVSTHPIRFIFEGQKWNKKSTAELLKMGRLCRNGIN